jgi:uncharacterized protein involved in exopolysaccharide biosynthesis
MPPGVSDEQGQETDMQEAFEQELHLLDVLAVLAQSKIYILISTVVVLVVVLVISWLIPNQYTASTLILPPNQGSSSNNLLGQLGASSGLAAVAGTSLNIKTPGDMYVALLHSRTLEETVIKNFGLMSRYHAKYMANARKSLEAHVLIEYGSKTGMITISARDKDPKTAADLANGYVDAFRKQTADLALSEASQRRVFFQQQLLEAKDNLTKAEESLKAMEKQTGIIQVEGQTKAVLESAATLHAQVTAKEVQLQAMQSYATDMNPDSQLLRQQLAALRGQIAKLDSQQDNQGLIPSAGKMSDAGLEYLRKLRDVKYYDMISELIARQYEMAKLDEARQGALVQVVDPAVVPELKTSPKRAIIVMITTLLGFLGACCYAVVADLWKRSPGSLVNQERWRAFRNALRGGTTGAVVK